MTRQINRVPPKRIENETPIEEHTGNPQAEEHKKMERVADRMAHKAAKTEQHFDEDHDKFSNIGSE
ncbi:MAG TPA: hypothetical protein VKB38_22005 [Terracidiphilus sp.]|nr:hypothetical protein [Terracidiphilus sp.]